MMSNEPRMPSDRQDRTSNDRMSGDGKAPMTVVKRQFFRRRKSCPFMGPNAMNLDYKDIRILSKFVSERGKMMPSRISAVSTKKQRDLSLAIKRARYLALMPYVNV